MAAAEDVKYRLRRAAAPLEAGGVPYAVVDGNAVAEWVGSVALNLPKWEPAAHGSGRFDATRARSSPLSEHDRWRAHQAETA